VQHSRTCQGRWNLLWSTCWGGKQKKVGDFQNDCVGIRHWVISLAPRRVRKMNQSIKVRTSKVRVLTFGLRPNVNILYSLVLILLVL